MTMIISITTLLLFVASLTTTNTATTEPLAVSTVDTSTENPGIKSDVNSSSSLPRQAQTSALLGVLFRGYSSSIRPAAPNSTNDFEPTQVSMKIFVQGIEEVSFSQQTMTVRFLMVCGWSDAHFVWDPKQFGGTERMLVKQGEVWIPDVMVGNSVHKGDVLGFADLPVSLESIGDVTWSPTLITTTSCEFNILYYPFDSQLCIIRLQTAASTTNDVVLSLGNDDLTFNGVAKNGQWELMDTNVKVMEDRRSTFDVYFLLKRRPSYYIFTSILPAMFLSILASLVFTLPADCGEKMGLSVTILLAHSVNLTTVATTLPESSLQVSVFVIYLTSLMILSALSIILSACVLKAHHAPDSKPVNATAIFSVKLFTATMTTTPKAETTTTTTTSTSTMMEHDGKSRRRINKVLPAEDLNVNKTGNDEDLGIKMCPDQIIDYNCAHDNVSVKSEIPNGDTLSCVGGEGGLTWQDVSVVWDRAMFRLFTGLVIVLNVVLISVMAAGEMVTPVSVLPEDDGSGTSDSRGG